MAQHSLRVEATGSTRTRPSHSSLRRVYACAECGEEITRGSGAFLLRNAYALPAEPSYHLHAGCMEAFTAGRPARWERTPLSL